MHALFHFLLFIFWWRGDGLVWVLYISPSHCENPIMYSDDKPRSLLRRQISRAQRGKLSHTPFFPIGRPVPGIFPDCCDCQLEVWTTLVPESVKRACGGKKSYISIVSCPVIIDF